MVSVSVSLQLLIRRRIVYNVANISSWKEIHLKEILENEFKVAVAINNDSNCFTLGESLYGEGKSYTNMVGVTIWDRNWSWRCHWPSFVWWAIYGSR